MRIKLVTLFVCALALMLGTAVFSQDTGTDYGQYGVETITGQDPVAQDIAGQVVEGDLETVTADTPSFYGQIVTLEGVIEDFLGARMFVLGEAAVLDNDQVLVINNSGHDFAPELMQGSRVVVTGRVLPSYTAISEGVQRDYGWLYTAQVGTVDMGNTGAGDTTGQMTATPAMGGDVGVTVTPSGSGAAGTVDTGFNFTTQAYSDAGMGAVDRSMVLGEIDRGLETWDETQRMTFADALDQDAGEWDLRDPETAQYLRGAATGLRDNDLNTARTSLQQATQRSQVFGQEQMNTMGQTTVQTGQGDQAAQMAACPTPDAMMGFNSTTQAYSTSGFGDVDASAVLGELDLNMDQFDETHRTQFADALDLDATEWDARDPETSQYLRGASASLRTGDTATARTYLQQASQRSIMFQQNLQTTPCPTMAADQTGQTGQTDQMGQAGQTMPAGQTGMMGMSRPNLVQWVQNGFVPAGFENFTIFEVVSIENISFVEFGEGVVGATTDG
ncbi:MAG: hypothetical protein IPK19_04970 [Chloroflexi bacterium]|nr:hypothetical protein [Chloroflexota bacterium]